MGKVLPGIKPKCIHSLFDHPDIATKTITVACNDVVFLQVLSQALETAIQKGRATALDEMQGFIEMSAGGQHG